MEDMKLTEYEEILLKNAARRIEAIFTLFGWTWKPKGRRVKVTWRRAYKLMKDNFLWIKGSSKMQKHDFYIAGGGSGRIWVTGDYDDSEGYVLRAVNIFVEVGSITMHYQDMFDANYKQRDYHESAQGLERARQILGLVNF